MASCDPGLPEVAARGLLVDVAPISGGPVCAGTVRALDHAMEEVERRLGLPDQDRVTFYWGPDGPEEYCPPAATNEAGVRGCAPLETRDIIGDLASFNHELVHVASRRVGRATPLIEEGLAVYASGQCVRVSTPEPITAYIGPGIEGGSTLDAYAIGGSFVAFLVERHGMPKLLELKAAAPPDSNAASFAAAVLDIYGEPLEAIEAHWREERVETLCGPSFPRWPETPSVYPYEPITLRSTLACDASNTYGPIDPTVIYGDGLTTEPLVRGMFARHALTIPQSTRIAATVDGPAGTKAQLTGVRCWDPQWDDDLFDPDLPGLSVITVHAGETRDLLLGGCLWNVYLVSDDYDEVEISLDLEPLELE